MEGGVRRKRYDFTLRPGVKFQDGKALTANDVKYTSGAWRTRRWASTSPTCSAT